jgi:hypothetical protein
MIFTNIKHNKRQFPFSWRAKKFTIYQDEDEALPQVLQQNCGI